ncbi:MAG: phospholipase D-like domain-containing protein [Stackebrandtia sp.]
MWKTIVGGAAAVALAAGVLALTHDADADPAPQFADPCGFLGEARVEACFSNPDSDDTRIFDSISSLAAAAGEGDTVRISMFHWRDGAAPEQLAEAVAGAHERGADVRVVLDKGSEKNEDGGLFRPIQILQGAEVPIEVCHILDQAADGRDDCLMWRDDDFHQPDSELPMNHVKLFSFNIDDVRSVVIGSSNMGAWDHEEAWNDMVRLRGDNQIGEWADGFVERLWNDDWDGWDSAEARSVYGDDVAAGQLPERAWAYPRPGDGDNISGQLSKVTGCSSAGDNRVWVAISIWSTNAREAILDQLDRIQGLGCDVKVVVSDGVEGDQVTNLRNRLGDDNVRILEKVHHKFIIVDAQYDEGGVSENPYVITGSHIFATGSLRHNCEINLRVGGNDGSAGVAEEYIEHFGTLYSRGG